MSRQIRNDMSPRVTQRSWTEAPYKGDPGTTSVSVKKISDHALEETDKRDGKVISVARLTASPVGKAMKIEFDDKVHGTQSEFTATKHRITLLDPNAATLLVAPAAPLLLPRA